mgnify:CR=1 FL=1
MSSMNTICSIRHTINTVDEYYDKGIISKVLTTNLIYQSPDLLEREWYIDCDLSKYIAYIIDIKNEII